MSAAVPNVFSIPPGAPFLETLAEALVDGRLIPGSAGSDPTELADATIFLPTRRATRALASVIARKARGGSVLLPRIVPLGDLDDTEENLLFGDGGGFGDEHELPPEADPMTRRLTLANMVRAWSTRIRATLRDDTESVLPARLREGVLSDPEGFTVAGSARDALALADALGRLIDSLAIHGKTWEDLHRLVPTEHDHYWEITRNFVEIAAREWPNTLAELNMLDAGERRHRLILAEAERLSRERPDRPFIVAGSTGSMPATAKLIAAIARLPRGAVVLPGLDRHLTAEDRKALIEDGGDPGHAQHLLAKLIETIGVVHEAVTVLGAPSPGLAAREAFLAEALRPAETTEAWRTRSERLSNEDIAAGLAGVSIVEADDEREEALAAAVALRETIADPGRTAALVTPDRALAERVCAELARWGIAAEDSAGRALGRTAAGRLARLAADALASGFAAGETLALLHHPLVRLGFEPEFMARGRSALEIGALRGLAPKPGLDGLAAAVASARVADTDRAPRPRKRLRPADFDAAEAIVAGLRDAFGSMPGTFGTLDLIALAADLEHVLEALVLCADGTDAPDGAEGGEALAALFDDLRQGGGARLEGTLVDLPGVLDGLMQGRTVQGGGGAHPRIRIWGLLEARLLPVDRLVLGGLDETIWPPATRTDPFLSRPVARELGLPAPEIRIGRTAHDFAQAMGAPEVVLTRAAKRGGDPTVPSRFLQRMSAVAGDACASAVRRGNRFLFLSRSLDRRARSAPVKQPAPVPPKELLPDSISVTDVEKLRRDPYAIFARRVLKLDPLDDPARAPNAAELGTATHDALGDFTKDHPTTLPPDARERLIALGEKHFAALADQPEFGAFWWPQFLRQVDWYLSWERHRRQNTAEVKAEIDGELAFDLAGGGRFTVRGRADRIEVHPDGSFSVLDYKTGSPPSVRQVRSGLAPQLTIQAAMALRGGYGPGLGGSVDDLRYVKLGREGGEETSAVKGRDPIDAKNLAERDWGQFIKLVDAHVNHGRGFASQLIPRMRKPYDAYDHLARFKEWSVGGEAEDPE
jgi:ATP-dependent helicase/nuclease subunit B